MSKHRTGRNYSLPWRPILSILAVVLCRILGLIREEFLLIYDSFIQNALDACFYEGIGESSLFNIYNLSAAIESCHDIMGITPVEEEQVKWDPNPFGECFHFSEDDDRSLRRVCICRVVSSTRSSPCTRSKSRHHLSRPFAWCTTWSVRIPSPVFHTWWRSSFGSCTHTVSSHPFYPKESFWTVSLRSMRVCQLWSSCTLVISHASNT